MPKNSTNSFPVASNIVDLDSTIGFQAALLTSRLRKSLLDILNDSKLAVNPDELGILSVLVKKESKTMSELAEGLMKDNANMTRMVKGLEKKGFVERKRDNLDRRISRVSLTERGEKEVKMAWALMDHMTSYATYNLTSSDQDRACEVLKTINENLKDFSDKENGAKTEG
jgi:DNA-binding MarR family transcriptional regulator